MVVKRGRRDPRTPIPSWKLYENPFYEGLAAAVAAATKVRQGKKLEEETEEEEAMARRAGEGEGETVMARSSYDEGAGSSAMAVGEGKSCVSARKLAASLWEEIPISRSSSLSASDSPRPSKIPMKSSPSSSTIPPLKTIAILRPHSAESISHGNSISQSSASSVSPLGMDALQHALGNKLQIAQDDLIASPRDFVKGIQRLRSLEERQPNNTSLVPALLAELELARSRLQELEASQKSARKEVDILLKKCADERATLRKKEQERIQAAMLSIREELDQERRARKKLESQNRKLSTNLSEANNALVEAMEELDKEREARRLMEDVCDELAKEIGQDKAEVEQMKRHHAKEKAEMEEERRMLQMAEVWREERVQMKLSEARLELEEKSMALDELRMELEEFLNCMEGDLGQQLHANQAEILTEAVRKLQAKTAKSMHLMEDTACQPPASDDAGSSDPPQWIVNPHFNEHARLWTNRRHSSRRRRNQGAMRSYGSRSQGLNRLGEKDAGEDFSEEGKCRLAVASDEEGSDGEHAKTSREDHQTGEESNWGTNRDNENERDDGNPWQHGVEENGFIRSSPENMHKFSGSAIGMNRKGHGGEMFGKNYSASIVGTSASNRSGNNHSVSNVGFYVVENSHSTVVECAPNQQQPVNNGLGSPGSSSRKACWFLAEPGAARASVDGSMDWLRPYRSNSLQAKLLEDKMSSPEFQSRLSRGMKAKR